MAIVSTLNGVLSRQREIVAYGTLVLSGSYVGGGEAFDFLMGPYTQGVGRNSNNRILWTTRQPYEVRIRGLNGNAYEYDTVAKKIKIIAAGAAAEVTPGAYPAGITGDTIRFVATFEK